jgi:hypothetical protein
MSAAIIVCTHTRGTMPSRLAATLQSLAAQELAAGERATLCVVFNGPEAPPPLALPQAAPVDCVVLHEPRRGKCRAANRALARLADSEFLLWADDDLTYPPHWARTLLAALRAAPNVAVCGPVEVAAELRRPWMTSGHLRAFSAAQDTTEPPEALLGGNMGFRRKHAAQLPGFDEALGPGALGGHEELLYSEMLRALRVELRWVPEARAVHHFAEDRLSAEALIGWSNNMGRSLAYVHHHWQRWHALRDRRMLIAISAGIVKHHLRERWSRQRPPVTSGRMRWEFWRAYARQMRALHGVPPRYCARPPFVAARRDRP